MANVKKLLREADNLYSSEKFDEAAAIFNKVITIYETDDPMSFDLISPLTNLWGCCLQTKNFTSGREALNKYLAFAKRLNQPSFIISYYKIFISQAET